MDIIVLTVVAALFWGLPAYLVFQANRATRDVSARWAVTSAGLALLSTLAAVFLRPIFGPTVAELAEPLAYGASFTGPWLAYVVFLRRHPSKRINDPRIRTNEFVAEHRGQAPTYALAVNVSTNGGSGLEQQIRLVGVELLHWKNMRGAACDRIMFVVLAERKAHQELKQAIAKAYGSQQWPGPFMRSVVNTVALLERDGTPVEEYQLAGAQP